MAITNKKAQKDYCKACNQELRPGAKSCSRCGAKIETKRVCASCGVKLLEGDVLCEECGAKYEGEAATQPASKLVHKCYNTLSGLQNGFVIMDDIAYFLDSDVNNGEDRYKIFSVSLHKSEKAKMAFDCQKYIDGVEGITGLRCHDGFLYFGVGDVWNIFDLRSYDITAGKHKLISESFCSQYLCIENGIAYKIEKEDATSHILVAVNLKDGSVRETKIPQILEGRAWPEVCEQSSHLGDYVSSYNSPIVYDGYIYTSIDGGVQESIRFPVNNPAAFDPLPYGACVYFGDLPFAVCNDILILPFDSLLGRSPHNLIALSKSNLGQIELFGDKRYPSNFGGTGIQYSKNCLVVSDENEESAIVYFLDKRPIGEHTKKADVRYAKMRGAITVVNTTYMLGNSELYEGLALYRVPNDRLFLENTNLDDYAQLLF